MSDYRELSGVDLDKAIVERVLGGKIVGEAAVWVCPEDGRLDILNPDFGVAEGGMTRPVYVREQDAEACDYHIDVDKPKELARLQEQLAEWTEDTPAAQGVRDVLTEQIANIDKLYIGGYRWERLDVVEEWSKLLPLAWSLITLIAERCPGWYWRGLVRAKNAEGAWEYQAWFRHDTLGASAGSGGAEAAEALCRAVLVAMDAAQAMAEQQQKPA